MSSVRVRNLDPQVISMLKDRAKRHGKTLEEELRGIFTEAAFRPRREAADRAQAISDAIRARVGTLSDSTPIIREEREARG